MWRHNPWRFFCFLACLLVFLGSSGWAAEQKATVLDRDFLQNLYEEIVLEKTPWPRDTLQIDNFSLEPDVLRVPKGKLDYTVKEQVHPNYLGRKTVTLTVLVDGKENGIVKMSGDLHLYGDVVCITRRLRRNSILTEGDVDVVRRDVSMLGADFAKKIEAVVGKELKTSLRAGAVLYGHLLEEPALVQRGDLVTIFARSEHIEVSAPGQARNAGAKGELVQVKNLMSRRIVYGRVVNPDVVKVDF